MIMTYANTFLNAWAKYDLIWIAALIGIIVYLSRSKGAPTGFWEQFWAHFSVVVLFIMFVIGLGVVNHMVHDKADAGSIQWAEGMVTGLLQTVALALGLKKEIAVGNGSSTHTESSSTTHEPDTSAVPPTT